MRKPTNIEDVARVLGMHKSTVSLALSGKGTISAVTRDRVRAVAQEMGYEPSVLAQRLAKGTQNSHLCLLSGALDAGLVTEKIRRIEAELSEQGWEVSLHTCMAPAPELGRSQADQFRSLCRQRPRAVVCAAQSVHPAAFRELYTYQQSGGIVVGYDTPMPLECDQVIFDREDNAYRAARRLLEAGHRRIGIAMSEVSPEQANEENIPRPHRLRGFQRALAEFGVPFRPEWLFENPPYERGGEVMAQKFLAMTDRPTGLCIVNDYVAFAFMVDVMRAGWRVPAQISIIGHDNRDIASRCPVPLTSVTQPVTQITEAVVRMLRERLNGFEGAARRLVVRGELVERDSIAPPQHGE